MQSLVITEDRHSHNGISRDAFVCHQPGINHCLRLNVPVAENSWDLFAEVDYFGNILRARGGGGGNLIQRTVEIQQNRSAYLWDISRAWEMSKSKGRRQ